MAECTHCPMIFSEKCSGCPEHRAEVAEYFGKIERRIRELVLTAQEGK